HSAGRWALWEAHPDENEPDDDQDRTQVPRPIEQWARQLARRYGVVFRDLLKREALPVTWRELVSQYRKMEWRGEMRGGRFVSGCSGEQLALPEAVETLRAVRREAQTGEAELRLSAADPLNLAGIILPGDRIASHISKPVIFRNGKLVPDEAEATHFA